MLSVIIFRFDNTVLVNLQFHSRCSGVILHEKQIITSSRLVIRKSKISGVHKRKSGNSHMIFSSKSFILGHLVLFLFQGSLHLLKCMVQYILAYVRIYKYILYFRFSIIICLLFLLAASSIHP